MSNSLEIDSSMMFELPLMCWVCSDDSMMMRVQPKYIATIWWSSYLMGSNDNLYIYTRVAELSAKAGI